MIRNVGSHLSMKGTELREIRKLLGYTQYEFAVKLDVTRVTIARWEKSEKIPDAQAKVVSLMIQNDTKEDVKGIPVNDPLSHVNNKNGLTYEELPNGKFRVKVPKVPFSAYASFIEVFEDEYSNYEDFDHTYFVVDHPGKGKYIAFTTKNDSMNGGQLNDTPGDAEVLGRELQRHHWKDGFRFTDYGWIIVSQQGMMHKDIEGPNEEGFITCKSRNPSPEFPDFKLNLNEVHTIWKVIKRTF